MSNTTRLFGRGGSSFAAAQLVYGHNGAGWVAAQKVYAHNGSGWYLRYGPLTVSSVTHVSHSSSGASSAGSDSGVAGISVSGGSGSYSYSWAYLSGDGSFGCSNSAISNPTFSRSFSGVGNGSTSTVTGSWRCTVTDIQSGATVTGDCSISLAWQNTSSGGGFSPVTNDYTSSGSETVPSGATNLTITIIAGDGSGGFGLTEEPGPVEYHGGNGGSGAQCVIFRSVASGDWGGGLSFTIDAGGGYGIGGNVSTSGSLMAGSIAMSAYGGSPGGAASSGTHGADGAGGSGSGGTVTSGTTGAGGAGGSGSGVYGEDRTGGFARFAWT